MGKNKYGKKIADAKMTAVKTKAFIIRNLYEILSFALPTIFFIIWSWPLVLHPGSAILSSGGDAYYDIWLFDNLVKKDLVVNFPAGLSLAYHIVTPPYTLLDLWAKTSALFIASPVVRYNLLIFLSFPLTGIFAFLLAKQITKDRLIALFCSLLICFTPLHMIRASNHINLSNIYFLLASMWLTMRFIEKPKFLTSLILGAVLALTVLDHYQYGLLAACFLFIALLVGVFKRAFSWKSLSMGVLGFVAAFTGVILSIAPWVLKLLTSTGTSSFIQRSFEYAELKVYSAQKFFFVLAPPNTLLGKYLFSSKYSLYLEQVRGSEPEAIIYGGIITLVLFFGTVAFFNSTLRALSKSQSVFYISLVIFGVLSLIASFAPSVNVFGYEIKMPAHYIFLKWPFFRVWSRFALGLIIAQVIIAGFALTAIKKKSRIVFYVLIVLAAAEILPTKQGINYLNNEYLDIYNLTGSNQVIAEYPLLPSEDPISTVYLLNQMRHKNALVYGATKDSDSDKLRKEIVDPSKTSTIDKLIELGVTEIIVHADMYQNGQAWKYPAEYNNGQVPQITDPRAELLECVDQACLYKLD